MSVPACPVACIDVLCTGDPRSMGLAQGAMLRERIRLAIATSSQQEFFRREKPWWLPAPFFLWLAGLKASRLLSIPLPRDFPEMHDRLVGIAEGSGLDLKTVYLINAIEPLLNSVKDRSSVPLPLAACSSVAVRSAAGEPVIARNFDYLPFVQPYMVLRDCRPTGRWRCLDFTVATMGGAVDGVNERGLCITYNYAYATDEGPPSAPLSMLVTEALESCSSVAEAADWIRSRQRWGGALLMLADATGDVASLEISNTRCQLRRPAAGQNWIFHTNAFHTPQMKEVQVSPRAVYNANAYPSQRGRRVLESAERRGTRLEQLLETADALWPDDLQRLLSDHGPDNKPDDCTICVHGEFRSTVACLQLFPRSRRMRVSYSPACQARFVEFSL